MNSNSTPLHAANTIMKKATRIASLKGKSLTEGTNSLLGCVEVSPERTLIGHLTGQHGDNRHKWWVANKRGGHGAHCKSKAEKRSRVRDKGKTAELMRVFVVNLHYFDNSDSSTAATRRALNPAFAATENLESSVCKVTFNASILLICATFRHLLLLCSVYSIVG